MFRRAFWFVGGVVAGISSFVWAKRRVVEVRESVTPGSLAQRTIAGSTAVVRRVRSAIAVGREVMRQGNGTTGTVPAAPPARRHIASRPRKPHG